MIPINTKLLSETSHAETLIVFEDYILDQKGIEHVIAKIEAFLKGNKFLCLHELPPYCAQLEKTIQIVQNLENGLQKRIETLAKNLLAFPVQDIIENQEALNIYNHLVSTLSGQFPTSIEAKEPRKPIKTTFFKKLGSLDLNPKNRSTKRQSTPIPPKEKHVAIPPKPIRIQQIDPHIEKTLRRVSGIASEMLKEFMLPLTGLTFPPLSSHFIAPLHENADAAMYTLIKTICLVEPRQISESDKQLILLLLTRIDNFFSAYAKALKDSNLQQLTDLPSIPSEEEVMIHALSKAGLFGQTEEAKNKKWTIETILEKVSYHTTEFVEWIAKKNDWDDEKKALPHCLAPLISMGIFNRFISKDTLSYLLDRICDPSFNPQMAPPPQTNTSPAYDSQFSLEAGKHMRSIFNNGLGLINSSTVVSKLSDIVQGVYPQLEKTMGNKIQHILHQILQDTCVSAPFFLLDQLLFQTEHEEKYFTWKQWCSLSHGEKEKRVRELPDKLLQKVYQILRGDLKKISDASGWIDEYYKTISSALSQKIFRLSQQERLLKLMVLYILEGLITLKNDKG